MEMMTDFLNRERCGVHVRGQNYSVALRTIGDGFSSAVVREIAEEIVNASDFILGPYTSTLTSVLAPVAQHAGKLLVASGAATTSIFSGRDHVFGLLPPSGTYFGETIRSLSSDYQAKSLAYFFEDTSFTTSACSTIPELSDAYNMTLLNATKVSADPSQADLQPLVPRLARLDPDVVLACVRQTGCESWVNALKANGWAPKASVMTICVGSSTFNAAVGDDARFFMGASPWDPSLPLTDEIWVGRRRTSIANSPLRQTRKQHI